ncbi:MAG TPA: alpha/beta hydrolase [Pseudonocardiaceae bacterium]|nr:alpha/beta hydrolase [Pseudonocardiaceae bacterium]
MTSASAQSVFSPHAAAGRARIVLVPDLGERLDRYDSVMAALADGADVVGLDHADTLVTDFEPVVDELAELVDQDDRLPVLVGQAVGGMVVVRYAQRYPGRAAGLVLAAPVLGPWPALDLLSEMVIPSEPYGAFERETLAAVEECLATIDFDHPLGDDLPALWLHSADDVRVPLADTRAGLDRVRGLRFEERIHPGGRHDLLREPTALAEVAGFVARIVHGDGSAGA